MGETRTYRVEDTEWLNLSAIGLLVDNDRWVDVGSIFLPIVNLSVDVLVFRLSVTPSRLTLASKAFLNARLSGVPVELSELVSTLRAVLIYD